MIKKDELEQIKKRCSNASSGPWKAWIEGRDGTSGTTFVMIGEGAQRRDDIELPGVPDADVDFIAHARQDIPLLLREIERLKSELEAKG